MQVAIFEGCMELNSYQMNIGGLTLDEKVDDFLTDHPGIEIKHVKQSSASSGTTDNFNTITTISIWYEEG